jgi:hypothetical protein
VASVKRRDAKYNPKRQIMSLEKCDFSVIAELLDQIRYGGNPEHKFNPGDFDLTPPSYPRKGKSLCDTAEIFSRKEALILLKKGLKAGLISERFEGKWPKNIWSITDKNLPLEAQLENSTNGTYHGYPLQEEDPFGEIVKSEWSRRSAEA